MATMVESKITAIFTHEAGHGSLSNKSSWEDKPVMKVPLLTILRRFPRNGAIGLIGSACTVILSWITLMIFSNRQEVTMRMLKPAAWTSIITSLNSIFIQLAVQQGISVSWWQKAASEKTTVAELHEHWLLGSGVVSALSSGKKFNWVALAVIFVATIPLNGLILGNAVGLAPIEVRRDGNTNFLMASSLPLGYSAYLNSDGVLSAYTSLWQNTIPSVFSSNSRAAFLSPVSWDAHTSCQGNCSATLEGIGFGAICEKSTVPYNLPTDTNPQSLDAHSAILQIFLTWNAESPTKINLTTMTKRHSSCVGDFEKQTCQLQMAKVLYDVNVQKNLSGHGNFWWSLDDKNVPGTPSVYRPSPLLEYYGVSPYEGKTNSTFGGIAQVLGAYYNTSTVFQASSSSNTTTLDLNGIYAQQVPPTDPSQGGLDSNKCNTSYSLFNTPIPATSGSYKDLTDAILTSLQHVLFFTSVSAASTLASLHPDAFSPTYIQTVQGNNDIVIQEVYQISWVYWWGSLIITFCIITFILPTYYGFWRLEEKKGLAPLATSEVFFRAKGRESGGDISDGRREKGRRRMSVNVEENEEWKTPGVKVVRPVRRWSEMVGSARQSRFTGDDEIQAYRI